MTDPRPFLVGGEWRSSDDILEVRFPYTNEVVGRVCQATEQDLEDAIRAAERGFEITRKLPAHARSRILYALLDRMQARRSELVETLILEGGKTRGVAEGETTRAMETVRVAAEEAKRVTGEIVPIDWTEAGENRVGFVRHLPLGPVLGIAPFNYPLNLASKAGPGHRGGQLVHPRPRRPHCRAAAAEMTLEGGFPPEALSCLVCPEHGRAAGHRRAHQVLHLHRQQGRLVPHERGGQRARWAGRRRGGHRPDATSTRRGPDAGGLQRRANCISVQRVLTTARCKTDGRQAAGPHRAIEGRRSARGATDVGPIFRAGSKRHGNRAGSGRVARRSDGRRVSGDDVRATVTPTRRRRCASTARRFSRR